MRVHRRGEAVRVADVRGRERDRVLVDDGSSGLTYGALGGVRPATSRSVPQNGGRAGAPAAALPRRALRGALCA